MTNAASAAGDRYYVYRPTLDLIGTSEGTDKGDGYNETLGYGIIPVSGDETTQLNLLALKDTARDLKAAGITAPIIPFRDALNNDHMLTADQLIELVDAGKQRVQEIYSASWRIKAMDPIPEDVTDDALWEV